MKHLIAAGILCAATLPAHATTSTLVIDVTGELGSGFTTWTFSGQSIAQSAGDFSSNTNFVEAEQFRDLGDFTDLDVFDVPGDGGSVSGYAEVSVASDFVHTRLIDSIFIDDDGDGQDDFAVGVAGTNDLRFGVGDLVSWTGSLTVFGIDIGNLDEGGLVASFSTSIFGAEKNRASICS